MANSDIVGELEFTSSSSEREIIESLASAFQSLKITTYIHKNDQLSFTVPFLASVSRGHRFQGISSGFVEVRKSHANLLALQYKLFPLPLTHIFIAIMFLWVAIGMPLIAIYEAGAFNVQTYLTFNVPAIFMTLVAFLASRLIIEQKFKSFLKKSISGNYSEIQQPARKIKSDIKKIALISCSGLLFLVLVIPLAVALNIWNMRSRVVWQYPLHSDVMAEPLIVGDVVYVGSIGNSEQSAFYALIKKTGEEIWSRTLNGGIRAAPVLVENMICFGTEDGVFQCLDQKTGSLQWEFGPEHRNLNANTCDRCALKLNTPLFAEDVIYIGSHDHHLYALDAQTGQLIWSFSANGSVFDAPAFENGVLYVGSQDGNVYALDPGSGREIRHYSIPSRNAAGEESGVYGTPIIDLNTLYAVNGTLTAIDIETGSIKWQVLRALMYEDQIMGRPILFKDYILVTTVGKIYAVDKFSGKVRWKYSRIKGGVYITPTLFDEAIYFGDSNGYLYGVNANTGRELFRYSMNYLDFESYTNFFPDFTSPPATDGEMIYVKWLNHFYRISK